MIANLPEPDHGSRIANARLIAAAPEMYTFIQSIAANSTSLGGKLNGPAVRARALLAKVEGER